MNVLTEIMATFKMAMSLGVKQPVTLASNVKCCVNILFSIMVKVKKNIWLIDW